MDLWLKRWPQLEFFGSLNVAYAFVQTSFKPSRKGLACQEFSNCFALVAILNLWNPMNSIAQEQSKNNYGIVIHGGAGR